MTPNAKRPAKDPGDLLEDALTWLSVNDLPDPGGRGPANCRRLMPTETMLLVPLPGRLELPGTEWTLPKGLHPKAWFLADKLRVVPSAVSMLVQADDDDGGYFVRQYRPIQRQTKTWRSLREDARGYYTLDWRHFVLDQTGQHLGLQGATYWAGAAWSVPYLNEPVDLGGVDLRNIVTGWADLACSMFAASVAWWFVDFGFEGTPMVSLKTDPIGAREAFRLRDMPNGGTRRAALRHWVREHWRRGRGVTATEEHEVRAHLRGATEFAWNGLRCRIRPSVVDVLRSDGVAR